MQSPGDPLRILILTDHSGHSDQNSLYGLVQALLRHPACGEVRVASRKSPENRDFFAGQPGASIIGTRVGSDFQFSSEAGPLDLARERIDPASVDWILLRLPPPSDPPFLRQLQRIFAEDRIINQPEGILQAGDKSFLLKVPELCPPMRLCSLPADAREFARLMGMVVLKPLKGFGGKGIVKTDGEQVWEGTQCRAFEDLAPEWEQEGRTYLAMKYLPDLHLGDKRTIVVDGKILGSSLRLPPEGDWRCNVALGGKAVDARPDRDEIAMAGKLYQLLKPLGIVIFGFDTLADEEGRRKLSEINLVSVGGLVSIRDREGSPVMQEAANLLMGYMIRNTDETAY